MEECCVCLGDITDACRAPCGHKFCRQCILKALGRKPPEWSGSCPLCRTHISVYNLRDASGVQLATLDVGTIFGCVFVQSGRVGLASYHFDAEEDCYISYASAPWTLDDGSPPPAKKPWADARYDAETCTFRGVITWDPPFQGDVKWDYEIIFAEDFAGVIGGRVVGTSADGSIVTTPFSAPWEGHWDQHLAYLRWTPPSSTIFGSIYVQGTLYSGVLEGIASYHFDSEDYCYISYTNAPIDWKLDDGSELPARKQFNDASYNANTRTFQGVVMWDTPIGGALKWKYEMVFAEDLRSICDGQMQPYGPNGRRLLVCAFGAPRQRVVRHFGDPRQSLYYVQKPEVLTLSKRLRAQLLMLADSAQQDQFQRMPGNFAVADGNHSRGNDASTAEAEGIGRAALGREAPEAASAAPRCTIS